MAEQQGQIDQIEVAPCRRGLITLNREEGIVTKRFKNPESPDDQIQIEIFKKVQSIQESQGPLPGFPKVLGIIEENGKVVGYEQELIKGKELNDYLKERGRLLSLEEAKKLFLTLVELQNVIGQPHGDIAQDGRFTSQNLLVTEGDDGQPRFHFIDYGGTADYNTPDIDSNQGINEMIVPERSMVLRALFIRTPYSEDKNTSYVEGSDEDRTKLYKELSEKYLTP